MLLHEVGVYKFAFLLWLKNKRKEMMEEEIFLSMLVLKSYQSII